MLVAAKTYALISEYALICDMRLITREYGILRFWETVDFIKCTKYIRHLDKVLLKVIEMEGDATGY